MQISVNLKNLEQLREYPERELAVVLKIENELKLLLQNAQNLQSEDVLLIERQINFIKEEIRTLRERKKLLVNICDIFYESIKTSRKNVEVAVQKVNILENI